MNWQKIKKDLLLALSSQFFYKIIGYVILAILTRHLAKEEMGKFFLAASVSTFFALITQLGMGNYLIREVAGKPKEALHYFSEVISIRLPLFAIYFILLNGFMLIIKPDLAKFVLLTSIYVIFEECYSSFGCLFLGLKRVAYNVISGVSTKLLLVGIIFVVVTLKGGLTEVISCYILANLLLVSIAFVISWRKIGMLRINWNYASARKVLSVSFPFFILTVLGLIHFKVDTLMLGFLKSYSEVATYESGYRLLEASGFAIRPIGMIFFPIFTEMATRQDWPQITKLLRKMLFTFGGIGGCITLVVVMTASLIIPAVFGSKYYDTIPVLRVLYLSVPMLYIASVSSQLAKSIRLEKKIIKIMSICVIINITLNGIIIPQWGALGAAWTTFVSETVLAIWLIKLNFKELNLLRSNKSITISEKDLNYVE